MAKKLSTVQLIERGRGALEQALSEFQPMNERLSVVTEFEGDNLVVQYFTVGKNPEDAVLVARACINRATGCVVTVETSLFRSKMPQ